jgi:hypothetical protein
LRIGEAATIRGKKIKYELWKQADAVSIVNLYTYEFSQGKKNRDEDRESS